MSRFDELKAKGYINLNKDERAEYAAYKDKSAIAEGKLEPQTAADDKLGKTETITLSKAELQDIIAQALQSHVPSQRPQLMGDFRPADPKKPREYTALLRKYRPTTDDDWGYIIDLKHLRWDYDENTRKHDKDIYKVKLWYPGGETKDVEFPIEEFVRLRDYETVKIISMKKEERVRLHGYVSKTAENKEGYSYYRNDERQVTSQQVPMHEKADFITCKVQLENGETMELPATRLNL